MSEILIPDMVNTIISVLLLPLLGIIAKHTIEFFKSKANETSERINNENLKKYIDIAEDAVCTAVNAVSQTFVEGLKKSSSFDQASMEEAFNTARVKALTIMGTATQESLKTALYDFDEWLNSKIEYYVATSKK